MNAVLQPQRTHGRAKLKLAGRIYQCLEALPDQVFGESLKVQAAENTVLDADVLVTCNAADLATGKTFSAPLLVIEVLLSRTQAYDRIKKFAVSRRRTALREYVLVDSDIRRVEAFRRNAVGEWVLHDISEGPALVLGCIETSAPMADMFDCVVLSAAETAQANT